MTFNSINGLNYTGISDQSTSAQSSLLGSSSQDDRKICPLKNCGEYLREPNIASRCRHLARMHTVDSNEKDHLKQIRCNVTPSCNARFYGSEFNIDKNPKFKDSFYRHIEKAHPEHLLDKRENPNIL